MSGITVDEAKRYFGLAMPNGTSVYVGLFTTLPQSDGTGGIESVAAWYSRVAHSAWVSSVIGAATVRRANVGAVEMPAHGLGDPDDVIVGWGIWDAATNGNLRWFGPLRDAAGNEQPKTLTGADQLRWTEGEFIAQISPRTDQTEALQMLTIRGPLDTADATPATFSLYTLADEEAVHVEIEIVAKHNGGGTDRHYYRKIRASYARDTTTSLWYLREQTADGAETRIGLTTATATLQISGNTIQAQVTGEGATALRWHAVVRTLTDVAPS